MPGPSGNAPWCDDSRCRGLEKKGPVPWLARNGHLCPIKLARVEGYSSTGWAGCGFREATKRVPVACQVQKRGSGICQVTPGLKIYGQGGLRHRTPLCPPWRGEKGGSGRLTPGWSYPGVEQSWGSCVSGVSVEMTYPLPRTVCIKRGLAGSSSSLCRSRWM